jgi:GTP-binding protein
VERALSLVDGVLLLVDAAEGPMPQTRFVLRKALEAGLKPIVVLNKVDKKEARPDEVLNLVFDLMVELKATEEQLDFPYLYAIGREGRYVTGQKLKGRLEKELRTNVALQVEEVAPEVFELRGRGELHLAILLETMRREGYEFSVGQPRVLFKEGLEPYELLVVEAPQDRFGSVMEALGSQRAEMVHMEVGQRVRGEFVVPARALFGFRSLFLSLTGGEGIMSHTFHGYGPEAGPIPTRTTGSAVAMEAGVATAYSLNRLQERVQFFIEPGTEVYVGMIVGEHVRENDLDVNVTIGKKLTNVRAADSDENIRLIPPRRLSLEEALEFLAEDELLEVTPKSLRLRKKVLNPSERKWLVGK